MAFGREYMYAKLELAWASYRRLSTRKKIRIVRGYLRNKFLKYITRGDDLANWQRRSSIETMVTDKHIRCWQRFLETDSQYLICCEDDVVFRENTATRLRNFMGTLDGSSGSMLYADLAGGLPLALLELEDLVKEKLEDRIIYARPTTNTACCYLLSRRLAENFMGQILVKPELRLVGIDWMMNAMFIEQLRRGEVCQCTHFSPTIFGHGTFTGEYVSWQAAVGA